MDVIKKQWSIVVQYQFWILSSLVLIAATTVFFLTSSGLRSLVAARTAKLNSTFEQVSTISSAVPSHPNSLSHAVMDKAIVELEKDIKKAWEFQYRFQIPLMVWPREAFSDAETHKIFSTLKPVEKYIDFPLPTRLPPPYDKITLTDRNVYKQYIGPVFANVSRKMGTEWKAQLTAAASAEAGLDGSASLQPDVVRWSRESQQTLLSQIVPWYNRGQAPTILDIYYTQEDMWLLAGIMDIIKNANGDARENFQTVVREVEFIRMGRYASRNAGVLTSVAAASSGGMMGMGSGDMGGGEMGSGGMGMGGGEMGAGGMGSGGGEMGAGGAGGEGSGMGGIGGDATQVDPADNRYISFAAESDFQPRQGAELRESIRTPTAANAVDAVAKRVAIRMRLKVDPSGLSRLITACGNANLMLEVYQVRVNTDAAAASGSGGGMSMGMGGGMGSMGMGGGMGMGGPGGGKSGMGSMEGGGSDGYGEGSGSGGGYGATTSVEDKSGEISVEIFGLIYLYNPDNVVSLGADLVAEKIDAEPTAPTTATETPPVVTPDPAGTGPAPEPEDSSGKPPTGKTDGEGTPPGDGSGN